MPIDINMSLGHWPFRKLAVTDAAGLVALMDGHGIQQALVANLEGVLYKDVMPANEALAIQVARYRERLIPQAVINPAFPGWERDLRTCAGDLGFRAVRLYPNYHGYALGDACFEELLAAAEAAVLAATGDLGLVVSVNVRMTDERMHHWRVMVPATDLTPLPALAAPHERVPIIVNCANNNEVWALAEGIRSCRNVFVEISHIEGPGVVADLVELIGVERVLFGSHAPYFYADSPRLKLDEAGIAGEQRGMIEEGNARLVLGLTAA